MSTAETVGFEPTRRRKTPTRFPGEPLRPLGHASVLLRRPTRNRTQIEGFGDPRAAIAP